MYLLSFQTFRFISLDSLYSSSSSSTNTSHRYNPSISPYKNKITAVKLHFKTGKMSRKYNVSSSGILTQVKGNTASPFEPWLLLGFLAIGIFEILNLVVAIAEFEIMGWSLPEGENCQIFGRSSRILSSRVWFEILHIRRNRCWEAKWLDFSYRVGPLWSSVVFEGTQHDSLCINVNSSYLEARYPGALFKFRSCANDL